jgi:hypothetical protein
VAEVRRTERWSSQDGERGAAVVEFALIVPVLLLIIFGIVEWSLVFKDSLTVTSATRAGARTASAQPHAEAMATATASAVARAVTALPDGAIDELWVYKAKANGMPDSGGFASCTMCFKFEWDQASSSFDPPTGSWPITARNACIGTSDAVGVYLKVDHDFLTGFFPPDMTITDHTVMNFEPIPVLSGCG